MVGLTLIIAFLGLTFLAWRRYLWVSEKVRDEPKDTCPYSLTDVFGEQHLINVPHQHGIQWLTDVFSRSARRFPNHTALQIPHTGESLTYAELDARAETVAMALAPFLTGPDQVVAVVMTQDNWHIVAAHLGVLRAGGTVMFLDTTLPETLISHMLDDAQPVAVLTRGQASFRGLPTLDVLALQEATSRITRPPWLDDPTQRLATIFYTSGTTGTPKGVECPHAGYVNLALSYADYFDLTPGLDATTLTSSLGYDGSISEMYSAWVSGCCGRSADQRAGPSRPRSRSHSSGGRGHRSLLSAGAANHTYIGTRGGSPVPNLPLYRPRGGGLPGCARRAMDAMPAADHQHLRPYRGEHRHEPTEFEAGGAHHNRHSYGQRHLRDPRSW